MNWRLTCLTLIVVPISAVTTFRVGRIMKRAMRRSLESMSSIYKILQESFQGIKVVKAFAMERAERRRFFIETKNFYRKAIRVAMIDAASDPVLEMLTLVTVAIALLAGSYLVLNKTIYLGLGPFQIQLASQVMAIEELLTLYAFLAGASDPIRKLSNVHSKLQRAAAASDRICDLMDREPQVVERPSAIDLPRHHQEIEFEDVHFRYAGRPALLKGISLTVRHGETIALVGPNGCGKTTLMNLLPRFWDVDSGTIRVDGHDVRDLRMRSFRRQIGIVLQETILFQDTIARNIAYGDAGASREQIVEAAKRAYAHQFIMALPQGYDTLIGERGPRPLRRPATANCPGPGDAPRSLDPDPRRGHQRRGHPGRGPDSQGHRRILTGPHHLLDLAQPRHHPVRRPDHPDRRRPDCRHRHRPGTPPLIAPLSPPP